MNRVVSGSGSSLMLVRWFYASKRERERRNWGVIKTKQDLMVELTTKNWNTHNVIQEISRRLRVGQAQRQICIENATHTYQGYRKRRAGTVSENRSFKSLTIQESRELKLCQTFLWEPRARRISIYIFETVK
jgi:hypothetical protein